MLTTNEDDWIRVELRTKVKIRGNCPFPQGRILASLTTFCDPTDNELELEAVMWGRRYKIDIPARKQKPAVNGPCPYFADVLIEGKGAPCVYKPPVRAECGKAPCKEWGDKKPGASDSTLSTKG